VRSGDRTALRRLRVEVSGDGLLIYLGHVFRQKHHALANLLYETRIVLEPGTADAISNSKLQSLYLLEDDHGPGTLRLVAIKPRKQRLRLLPLL
jgi:hypothetical protein